MFERYLHLLNSLNAAARKALVLQVVTIVTLSSAREVTAYDSGTALIVSTPSCRLD